MSHNPFASPDVDEDSQPFVTTPVSNPADEVEYALTHSVPLGALDFHGRIGDDIDQTSSPADRRRTIDIDEGNHISSGGMHTLHLDNDAGALGGASPRAPTPPAAAAPSLLGSLLSPGGDQREKKKSFWSACVPSFCKLDYYQPYFDVSTDLIFSRIKRAFWPFTLSPFFSHTESPDLYGPFWICTTLVFLFAAAGNMSSFINYKPTEFNTEWLADFGKVAFAASMVYGFAFVLPVMVWVAFRFWIGSPLSLVNITSCYGYSLVYFAPAAVFCTVPNEPTKWVFVMVAAALSAHFLVRTLASGSLYAQNYDAVSNLMRGEVDVEVGSEGLDTFGGSPTVAGRQVMVPEAERSKAYIVIALCALTQIGFGLLTKFKLFEQADS